MREKVTLVQDADDERVRNKKGKRKGKPKKKELLGRFPKKLRAY